LQKASVKKNIILELDSFYLDRLVNWLSENQFNLKYNIFVVIKTYNYQRFVEKLSQFSNVYCVTYEDIFSYQSELKLEPKEYYDFNKQFFNNHLTARFTDRSGYLPKYGIGIQNAFTNHSFSAYNTLLFLKDHNVDFMCFRNTPHNMKEWILVSASEFLNIDIYTFEDFIFPWLFTIKKGCLNQTELVFEHLDFINKADLKAHIQKSVEIASGDYEQAIPTYEKKRMGKGLFKFFNPFKNIKDSLVRPHQFLNRARNYYYYKKASKVIDLKQTEYIAFFLHFQPERSTLPEGYDFVDQFFTIKLLSLMLPDNVKLLVKEHPSMFTRISEPKFRSLHNYKLIEKLDNVEYVSMHMDSFSLIDHSKAVVSTKGTVCLEAYMRQKPVIMFGKTNLKNMHGVHNYNNINDLEQFIQDVIKDKISIHNVVEQLTEACDKMASCGITTKPENTSSYSFTREIREDATYPLLTKLLQSKLN